MLYSSRVRIEFDAGHQVASRERCKRSHGHRWSIEAERRSGRDLAPSEGDELAVALLDLVTEWESTLLNEMIPNFSETTPERLAPLVMERLVIRVPSLMRVSVSDGHVTGIIDRELLR